MLEDESTGSKRIYIYSVESEAFSPGMREYFAKFGEIDLFYQNDFGFALIQFTKTTSALSASTNRDHIIDGKMVEVYDLFEAPKSPCDRLNSLNDDCLMKIFEYLPLWDLCNLAEVCRICPTFKSKAFVSNFDINKLIEELDVESDMDWESDEEVDDEELSGNKGNCLSMELVERFFRHFGASVKTISLDRQDFNENQKQQILEFIAVFCSDENAKLEKLVFHDINIINLEGRDHRLDPIFRRLKSLDIIGGSSNTSLLSNCPELKELILEDVYLGTCSTHKFENLQKCSLVDIYGNYDVDLERFVLKNPQLKSLIIIDSNEGRAHNLTNIFRSIGNLLELEELKIQAVVHIERQDKANSLLYLARLKHLKMLSLNCELSFQASDILKMFAEEKIPLEDLDLTKFHLDIDLAKSMSKFIHLKKLRLSDGKAEPGQIAKLVGGTCLQYLHLYNFGKISVDDIKEIIKNAHELKEFQLYHQYDIVINSRDFNDICQLIRNRENYKAKLNINIAGDRCKLNVSEHDIKSNRLWVEVQVATFKGGDFNIRDYYDDNDDSDESE